MKIWERIIERRLRDEHFGFMPGRGTAESTFAVRERMEKQEKSRTVYRCIIMVFIDLEKACDRVSRQQVWRRNRERDCEMRM